jgi:hypothetical protein
MKYFISRLLVLVGLVGVSLAQSSTTNIGASGARRNLTEAEIRSVLSRAGVDSVTPVGCAVLDPNAVATTTVPAFNFGQQAYWLKYAAHGVYATSITFIVRPLFTGSPLTGQKQNFTLSSPDNTDVSTPFGIPSWALDATAGPWLLIVQNDLGNRAACRFTVTP